mgnify:FL=1
MELLQLVEKFKNVFSIEKIEDVVDELKSTLLNAEKCRKLCEDWILICPDLTIDYMQMIFQYYFADRKEKMQDYTPKSLAVAVAELSKTKDEKICLDLCAGSGALTIQKWNENNDLKFICKARTIRIFNPSVNIFPTKNPAMMDTRYEIAASYKTIVFKSFFDIPILCKNTYSGIRFPRYDMSTVMISIIPQNNRIVPAERKLLLIPSSCIKYSDECPLENI